MTISEQQKIISYLHIWLNFYIKDETDINVDSIIFPGAL